ncbi:MAG: SMP-30/gluconolactonase/LRE family protein [Rhodospirillales bacterium]|nr:SMP-30/gluconolactonase/LRE family protein [Rhodospirillales bacterium]
MTLETLDDTRCHLGEGPLWDIGQQALYWVDSLAPSLFRHDWATRTTQRWDLSGDSIGSLAVRRTGGLIMAMDTGFYFFNPRNGQSLQIADPLADTPHSHFNDGKVDRAGRFVAGGVHGVAGTSRQPEPVCGMFCLDTDLSVRRVLDGFACFNGPCFSPDGKRLYVTGRGDMKHIEAFDYDPDTGRVDPASKGSRVLIDDIDPDGATVDADGFIWSAQWGDGCVLRLSPEGVIDRRIEVPGQVVSSVMFGGPDLDILFVTTLGQPHWGTTPTADHAGAVFVFRHTGVKGLPEHRFEG